MADEWGPGVRIIGPAEGDAITFRNGVRVARKMTSEETGGRWAVGVGENPNPGFVNNSPYLHGARGVGYWNGLPLNPSKEA